MAIDIDKNFKKKPLGWKLHRTRAQRDAALEKMKKLLIQGVEIKVACIDSGYDICKGMEFFKNRTGETMTSFKRRFQKIR